MKDDFLRQKIEMFTQRETKTRAGEGRAALDRTFVGADFDEGEEIEDENEEGIANRGTRGLLIERRNVKKQFC